VPGNPAAWLTTVAQRKLLDRHRRERTHREHEEALRYEIEGDGTGPPSCEPVGWPMESDAGDGTFPDDRLRLLFTCCHPALEEPARVALPPHPGRPDHARDRARLSGIRAHAGAAHRSGTTQD